MFVEWLKYIFGTHKTVLKEGEQPIRITCSSSADIPAISKILELTSEGRHIVLRFPKDKWQIDKKAFISQYSKDLQDYSIFDSGGDKETEWITIKPVIKRGQVIEHIDEIHKAFEEYQKMCSLLLPQFIDNDVADPWKTYQHGGHICFSNKITGQIIEVPFKCPVSLDNVDPYFWGIFIKTTPRFSKISPLIRDEFHDTLRIIDILRDKANE